MTPLLKCTVSGMIDEVFIGTNSEITKRLIQLKKLQEDAIGQDILKRYASKSRKKQNKRGYSFDGEIDPKQKQFGLKIKIEPFDQLLSNSTYF